MLRDKYQIASFMLLKKKRTAAKFPTSAALNCDDRKKFAAFVSLLIQIDKRINADAYTHENKKITSKKMKKGSPPCGPLLFKLGQASLLWLTTLSLFQQHNRTYSLGIA